MKLSGTQPSALMTAGWISAVVKVLPAAMCAKRTSACMRARCDCRFRELSQLAAIDKGFQDILLDVEVVIVDRR